MPAPEPQPIPGIVNEDWTADAVARAYRLYPNQGVQRLAALMAKTHRYAIDYMEQCPALIVYAPWGGIPRRRDERAVVAARFGSAVQRGPKLKDMMAGFNGPLAIRGLSGTACIPVNFSTILALRRIPSSDLAQAIPERTGDQLAWLRLLRSWKAHIDHFIFSEDKHRATWEWMAKAGSIAIRSGIRKPEDHSRTIVDMLYHGKVELNPAWTFQGALNAADRWHAELAKKKDQERFLQEHGFGFEDACDYGLLPEIAHFGDLTFLALRSGLDLFMEGAAMRHCVASYVRQVMLGSTRIYSVRRGERRIATLELFPQGRTYRIAQLKGPCNRSVLKADAALVAEFVTSCNAAILEAAVKAQKDWTKPGAYLDGGSGQ